MGVYTEYLDRDLSFAALSAERKKQLHRISEMRERDILVYAADLNKSDAPISLTALRERILGPLIAEHSGRVVKIMGDGLLVEFASLVNAVGCAIAWQTAVDEHEAERSEEDRMSFRIGVNLGDVLVEGEDIHGDGVNIAARLEGLAAPGGICLSGDAYRQVRGRVAVEFEDLGEQRVKNIAEPVQVYRVASERSHVRPAPAAKEALMLPGKPSIAVLPFVNMSGDPEQEYFSDGITADIITELSRFPILYVIARQSIFGFKGERLDVKEIGRKLGVEYVVEGTVRRAGKRARMTAQLIEAETGNHLWAERYDRELEDIFAVQDEVTRSVVAAVAAQLGKTVSEKAASKPTTSIKSYEFFLQANRHYYRFNPDNNMAAAQLYQKAIEHDPQFARAYAGLANCYVTDYFLDWRRTADALPNGLESARICLELDGNDILGRTILSWALIGSRRWEEAELELNRALSLRSGDADMMAEIGHGLYVVGRHETGIDLLEEAVHLNPLFPDVYRRWLGIGYYRTGRYRDAATALRAVQLEGWGYGWLAASFARLGESERAREALDRFLDGRQAELGTAGAPADSAMDLLGNYQNNFRHESEWKHFLDGLRQAGLEI
jgi:TolB-like protein